MASNKHKQQNGTVKKSVFIKPIGVIFACLLFIGWSNNGDNKKKPAPLIQKSTVPYKLETSHRKKFQSDTLEVSSKKVILLIPSEKEIDSLINLWGEDKFYDIAYDENRKLSRVYGHLDKNKIHYEASNKAYFRLTDENRILKKQSFPYAWGVLYIDKNGSYQFKTTIDFLLEIE